MTEDTIQIRLAKDKDVERIAILCEQLGYSTTPQQIEQRLVKIQDNKSHVVYVATLANDYVVGWAQAHTCDLIIMPNQALLFGLVVDADYRYAGIGRKLMQYIEEWADLVGCEGIILRSNIKRKEAHIFYEKIGYANTKQSMTFYKKITSE
ncbi:MULTISPECIES: GNAT family N-acetyltransferase [unclassified Tolypothrix]|uniref:GNAT family N-acetyltransferase n=1 Tax=unclassified Tolypothrix TaxID=2649714 RepID=UPI0005EABDB6|nr:MULTISPECIES: GNAT family N-acetyltransferase [unclassified Tolypothrix]BAY89935.1 GCN5-related N-acetyltransferase [Microchaete diplosiphon NIES-3275]EKE96951.1 acetyltransferase, GNAT family [Tolypothrix sp. PCC 7601]MBE9082125.1 GNAT family N-acetyltransferase [Tolypothrix sp. LEGE 11397]UYD24170.1 GNAT family N-acetyltransferase [Tolypothrix sp. PCC 7712]UYD33600.1 GNAT family N-acetyltransferase [Tolypothrix sp. PCC 7601]